MVPRALLLFLVGCLLCLLGQVRFYLSLLSVPCKPIPPVAWSPSCGVALTGTHKSLFGPRRHAKPTCTVSLWERDLCRCPQCEWFTPHLKLRAEVNGEPPLAACLTDRRSLSRPKAEGVKNTNVWFVLEGWRSLSRPKAEEMKNTNVWFVLGRKSQTWISLGVEATNIDKLGGWSHKH